MAQLATELQVSTPLAHPRPEDGRRQRPPRRRGATAPLDEPLVRFVPPCPEFVVELRSPTDGLSMLKNKMREYMANDAQLGWLFDPRRRRVYVYRPGVPAERLDDCATLASDPVLPGFVLDVQRVFEATF